MTHFFKDVGTGDPWEWFALDRADKKDPFLLDLYHAGGHWIAKIHTARSADSKGDPIWEYRCGTSSNAAQAIRNALKHWGIKSVDPVPDVPAPVPVSVPVAGYGQSRPAVGVQTPPPPVDAGGDIAKARAAISAWQAGKAKTAPWFNGFPTGNTEFPFMAWPGIEPAPYPEGGAPDWIGEPVKWKCSKKFPVRNATGTYEHRPTATITWGEFAGAEEGSPLNEQLWDFLVGGYFVADPDRASAEFPFEKGAAFYKKWVGRVMATIRYSRHLTGVVDFQVPAVEVETPF